MQPLRRAHRGSFVHYSGQCCQRKSPGAGCCCFHRESHVCTQTRTNPGVVLRVGQNEEGFTPTLNTGNGYCTINSFCLPSSLSNAETLFSVGMARWALQIIHDAGPRLWVELNEKEWGGKTKSQCSRTPWCRYKENFLPLRDAVMHLERIVTITLRNWVQCCSFFCGKLGKLFTSNRRKVWEKVVGWYKLGITGQ